MINVTKPFLPPKEEYLKLLDEIWERNWLTNNGPVLLAFEEKLKDYLSINNLLFLTNGTVAIQLAIKALELSGEIITTPFSYVATTSSIVWEGLKPVFVDIDKDDFNIDVNKIEEKITDKTTAILATHVFGNACDIDGITRIADKYNLKVIYDAAHCFGTKYKNESIFKFGDISTTSFHATKLLSTIEGGCVFTEDENLYSSMQFARNFGHNGPEKFAGVGINAKNSEFHAAMGLTNMKYIDEILVQRKEQWEFYQSLLTDYSIHLLKVNKDSTFNYSYFPIVLQSENQVKKVIKKLNDNYIFPRRYFYPSLNTLDYVEKYDCPISEDISVRVLTLPLFHDLRETEIKMICKIITEAL